MCTNIRKNTRISFVIRDEKECLHKNGVSSLQLDPVEGRLYSAGRDGMIRVWDAAPGVKDRFIESLENHTDWVNDIVLCRGGKTLFSASSDSTAKVWDVTKRICKVTLRAHTDFVRALAYAEDKEHVASGGLDKIIYLWDVNRIAALTRNGNLAEFVGSKESIYSLAMNPPGTILVSGSTENLLRVWDPRGNSQLMELKGHSENVKALVVNRDGTQCISGSSDGTIKVWSLGQQTCLSTIRVHSGAVWALLATENFTHIISGGRDKLVIVTELMCPENYVIICQENAPILKMCFTADQQAIWVSTSESDIRCWKLPPLNVQNMDTDNNNSHNKNNVYQTQPIEQISGGAAIIQYEVLNDKRYILTKDTANHVALYDVLKATKVEDLGKVNFEKKVKKRFKEIYVPNWFKVDLKTGLLTINLEKDETSCLSAWVSAKAVGLTSENIGKKIKKIKTGHNEFTDQDQKVNLGVLMLQALLEHWKFEKIVDGTNNKEIRNTFFSVPLHTTLIFTEIGGFTQTAFRVGDARLSIVGYPLVQTIPWWIIEVAIKMEKPKFQRMSFYLLPYSSSQSKQDPQRKDLLEAKDVILCSALAKHIVEKIIGSDGKEGTSGGVGSGHSNQCGSSSEDTNNILPEGMVELLCQNRVIDPNMDLRTVQKFVWKSKDMLTLHYRTLNQ